MLPQQLFCRSAASFSAAMPPLKLSCLLETWSPCSRPFAILPVSAVSDAQKLATGNFLHVRAESLSLPGRHAPRAFLRRPRRLFFPPAASYTKGAAHAAPFVSPRQVFISGKRHRRFDVIQGRLTLPFLFLNGGKIHTYAKHRPVNPVDTAMRSVAQKQKRNGQLTLQFRN